MDPISSINIKKDSSFAILLEAQQRKHQIYYIESNSLVLFSGKVIAKVKELSVRDKQDDWYSFKNEKVIELNKLNVILMRKDPPFNNEFVYITYILEYVEKEGVIVINNPKSLRDCNEKIFINSFPSLIPNTLVTCSKSKINEFWLKHGDIVIKPLDKMGGNSIFRIKKNDFNFSVIVETLTNNGRCFCMAQEYLPSIKNGDKRILIVNGKIIPYCLTRIPKDGENRSNLAVGGIGITEKLNSNDWNIANLVSFFLKKRDIFFAGLDVIGNKLTEINIISPTCIREIERDTKYSISGIIMDFIEKKIEKRKNDL